jgi:receptor protein-tyrosine kinase
LSDQEPPGRSQESLAERVARKLSEGKDKASPVASKSALERPAPAPAPAPAPTPPPVVAAPIAAAAPPAAQAPSAPPPAPQNVIDIPLEKLRAAGFITPNSGSGGVVEEFRLIKRQLMRSAFDEDNRVMRERGNVIMVTSALPGEGKSFVALNLAISFSLELDFYVLLVDVDNHRHQISTYLGLPKGEAGLVDVLVDQDLQMRDVIRRTSISNLSVIAAGRPRPNGTEILASKNMAGLLDDLTKRYPDRIIVIDVPPLLNSTEGLVLAPHVGQAVVVVEKDRTTKRALNQALDRLRACPEVGCVLYSDHGAGKSIGKAR